MWCAMTAGNKVDDTVAILNALMTTRIRQLIVRGSGMIDCNQYSLRVLADVHGEYLECVELRLAADVEPEDVKRILWGCPNLLCPGTCCKIKTSAACRCFARMCQMLVCLIVQWMSQMRHCAWHWQGWLAMASNACICVDAASSLMPFYLPLQYIAQRLHSCL